MKKDGALILSILIAALALWLGLRGCQTEAGRVSVEIDGAVFGSYELQVDRTVSLPHHTLLVEGGGVRVARSDCAGQDCVKTGAISRGGQAILCLPYRLNVQITASDLDAVTY